MKIKFKFLTLFLILFLLFSSSLCFAVDSTNDTLYSDLYLDNKDKFDIKNIIKGNVFTAVDELTISPENNGGIIEGNLYAVGNTVNIKSDVSYSENEKDDLGNNLITINKSSLITGNVFVTAGKFTLEPGSVINGDLYICAKEVHLEQNSKIYGNVFVASMDMYLNAEISGSLYGTVNTFNMDYYGFINRDLHLTAENANINGYIYRSSTIEAKNITTKENFINQKDFNVEAESLTFSGEVKENANINVKNLVFENNENCKISGNLSYSSNNEINIPEGIVLGEVNYSKYVDTTSKSVWSVILDYLLDLITVFVTTYIIYLIISKFAPKYLDKISNLSGKSLLKYFGIGFGLLMLIPIIIFLLFLSTVGSILGFILLFIYIVFIILARPIFVIAISKFAKDKLSYKFNIPLYILIISVILAITYKIPYLGFILSMLINFIGFGIVTRNLLSNKK